MKENDNDFLDGTFVSDSDYLYWDFHIEKASNLDDTFVLVSFNKKTLKSFYTVLKRSELFALYRKLC